MNQLTERSLPRLGIVAIATVLMVLSLVVFAPIETSDWPYWAALGVIGAMGTGLVFRARFARVLGVLGALACLVLGPRALYQTIDNSGIEAWDATMILGVANAVATTLLGFWLALRAVQVLADRARTRAITTRIVGGTFAIVAIDHLWLAYVNGFNLHGAFSMSASSQGILLVGFPGWPVWHVALLVVALAMAFGPRPIVRMATTALMALAFALVPLVVIMLLTLDHGMIVQMFAFMIATTSLGAYLAWWLRDENQKYENGPTPRIAR